jgi:GNAT superfamily N-acetyltransferase
MNERLTPADFEMPERPRTDKPFPSSREDIEASFMPTTTHRQRPLPLTTALRVRRATLLDLAPCVRMAVRFSQEPPYGELLPANVGAIEALIRYVLDYGAGFVAVKDESVVGMIGASINVHPFTGELVASEAAWWIDLEHRGGTAAVRLLAEAEAWARDNGAVRFQMVAPVGRYDVRDLYLRRDYAELETIYQRVL